VRSTVVDEICFAPLSEKFLRDPMPILARVREATPVFRHEETAFPVVSVLRHREVKAVYRDFKNFSSFMPEEARRYELADGISLLGEDPPLHTHLRSAVNKVFTAHAINRLEADVQPHTRSIGSRPTFRRSATSSSTKPSRRARSTWSRTWRRASPCG
jgi:cytochrome P450